MEELHAVKWHDGKVRILDQTKLPHDLVLLEINDHHGIVGAIKSMNIRGAPAIGIAAAFGVVLSVWNLPENDRMAFIEKANEAIDELKATRPTAQNLFWALEQMRTTLAKNLNRPLRDIKGALLKSAENILQDDIDRCKKIGRLGADLLPYRCMVLTYCNAGALATGGFGTALGVIRTAFRAKKVLKVYACETRPLFQGARLTAFELMEEDIPITLICDNMAAALMQKKMVHAVVVGADRIAKNGDVANKIGTYALAVLARYHNIPFYVAVPFSTFDFSLDSGEQIPIEERDGDEVRSVGEHYVAPSNVDVYNPAFDVTPAELIVAIITEKGVIKPPFEENLRKIRND